MRVPFLGEKNQLMTEERKLDALQRLSRIEGQVRGIKKMLEEDRRCIDVLTQVASIQEALRGLTKVVMRNYMERCATEAIRAKNNDIYDELMDVIFKFAK